MVGGCNFVPEAAMKKLEPMLLTGVAGGSDLTFIVLHIH